MRNLLQKKNEHSFSGYNGKNIKSKLLKLYHYKCGYCESNMDSLVIEHYRPKKRIDEAASEHKGYYWLAFEWTNLIISCVRCNNQAAKGNHFPLEHEQQRVMAPPDAFVEYRIDSETLKNEKPLLLNPEFDTPEEHITFRYNGNPMEKNNSIRGKKTIEICKLDRDFLVIKRKELIDNILRRLKEHLLFFLEEIANINPTYASMEKKAYKLFALSFNELRENCQKDKAFSRTYTAMFKHFNTFLDSSSVMKNVEPDIRG